MEGIHTKTLIYTGLSMGILHVLAGPDHLSALAVLSVGNSWRALTLGLRWGLGHSTGLILVFMLFIALKGELDLQNLGRYCDILVGAFMIILGTLGLYDVFKMHRAVTLKKDVDESSVGDFSSDRHIHEQLGWLQVPVQSYLDMRDPVTQRIVSFSIGILHGVAGPGGILGVLPAVEMKNLKSATVYLGSFIIASTISMGSFAAIYGEVTKRLGTTQQADFALRIFSACLSVMVGVIWLVLSILGKLDEYFH